MKGINPKYEQRLSGRWLRISGVIGFLIWTFLFAVAQEPTSSSPRNPADSPPSQRSSASKAPGGSETTLQGFEGKLASAIDLSKPDSGDYIPCEFTLEQLLTLRPKPAVVLFGKYEEEKLKSTVISEVSSLKLSDPVSENARITFIDSLTQDPLVGLTPSEALAHVIKDLADALDSAKKELRATQASEANTGSESQSARDAANVSNSLPPIQTSPPLAQTAPPQQSTQVASQTPQPTPGQTQAQQVPSAASKPGEPNAPGSSGQKSSGKSEPGSNGATLSEAGDWAAAVVDSARTQISAFQRPPDIGCAMSVLDWNELRYAFGQTIADEYIGVQIVVRNMNPNQEFLVHDAEVSVDSDLNGRYGRFFSGQDKLTVRNFMLSSRDYGRRNFLVNMAQGIGTVLSSTATIYGPNVQNAASVFHAGFLSALPKVWTDHNTEQLNLLNDVGFSASKTDRTVVPKSGTAMFVVFILSKQFETSWWVQDCANRLVLTPVTTPKAVETYFSFVETGLVPSVGGGSLQSGVDLDSLRAICLSENGATAKGESSPGNTNAQPTLPPAAHQAGSVKYMIPNRAPYRKWSPSANAIFQEISLAVVAGTHFTENTSNVASLSAISCPKDALGNLDLSKASAGSLQCDLAGQNLDKVHALRLRNTADATDLKTADGNVSTSGDSTKATAKFAISDLGALLAPAYKVYTVSSDGTESGGSQVVHVSLEPFLLDDPNRPTIQLDQLATAGAKPQTITLKGFHLDKLTTVHLGNSQDSVSSSDTISIDIPIKGAASASAASFDFTPDLVSKLPKGTYTSDSKLTMYIFLVSKDSPGTKSPTGQALEAVGTVKAAAPTPAPAPNKTPAKKNK